MLKNKRISFFLVLAMTVLISTGILISTDLFASLQGVYKNQIKKFMNVVHLAQLYYLEDVDWDRAMEGAIKGMLENLDPHSIYISQKRAEENKENFNGNYEGIGIKFDVLDGQLTVITPIVGSPSDKLGIHAGDRIIKINGKPTHGISTEEVIKKLKGPKGTAVEITIIREGEEEPFEISIIRDVIPITTITTSFMADDSTGYMMLNRFAATTALEVEQTLEKLEKQKMKRLILDLRRNPGGYLHEAVKVAGKFISGHRLIVYTEGRNGTVEEEYYSDQFGRRKARDYPLIVLIDHGSASASEIVAGAIQDYDRGLILGTNSFGKGLVQKEFNLQDGSAVRITTAKYFTPLGRSIQRNYKDKDIDEYYAEVEDTALNSAENLKHRPLYHTKKLGRSVYGGGGIKPDITVEYNNFGKLGKTTNQMLQKRLFFQFAADYSTKHDFLKLNVREFEKNFKIDGEILNQFSRFCVNKGIKINEAEFATDEKYISLQIKAEIARIHWDDTGYYYVVLNTDNQFLSALRHFDEAERLAALEK